MKEFTASGYYVDVGSVKKQLSCKGSSNCEIVCFSVDRYCNAVDLSQCNCTIKTKNSDGKADVILPAIEITRDTVRVLWTVSSASTSVPGELLVQIQFEKIFDDNTKNIVWQSNIMEFMIQDSLNSADEVFDQNPTLFQQWDEKMNTAYSDVSKGVETVQSLASQVETTAGQVSEQEQNISQLQVQASQRATEAQNAAQNAQASAAQAKTSETNALTAENLCKGYANAVNTYSKAAAASAQTSEQQAASAKADADRAQQIIDGFAGITKQEADSRFANGFLGEKTGTSISLDDVQPGTYFRSLLLHGQTAESGIGTKSPDNPSTLSGTAQVTVSDGASQSQEVTPPQALYSLPSGTHDIYEAVGGVGTQNIEKAILNGSETWSYVDASSTTVIWFQYPLSKVKTTANGILSNKFKTVPVISQVNEEAIATISTIGYHGINIKIAKSRISGWSDSWTPSQKTSSFKVWLALNPITVLYELTTPVSTQQATQAIEAYSPNTSILTDNGIVAVQYSRDSNVVLKKLEDKIAALIAK